MKSGYMAELCKILVIDDEEINTLQLEHVLDECWGYLFM